MELYELIAPCHFGLEAVMKREILDLGYEIERVEDGKVTFLADAEGIAYANLFLRTTERILLKVGQVHAETYDELFEATKALPWEKFIPKNGKFWVTKANSIKSKLFSPSDIQSIMKKAIVERLKQVYHMEWFPEDGAQYPIRVSILKDEVTIGLDTSGVSLHKRGYRKLTAKAPITETLAAALIMLTPWKSDRIWTRWGRRKPFMLAGMSILVLALIAAPFAPSLWALTVTIILYQFAMDLGYTGPWSPLLYETVPLHQRGRMSVIKHIMGVGVRLLYNWVLIRQFDSIYSLKLSMGVISVTGEQVLYFTTAGLVVAGGCAAA